MRFRDNFIPPLPKELSKRHLVSTYIQKRQLPNLEMTLKEDGVFSEVKFNFILLKKN